MSRFGLSIGEFVTRTGVAEPTLRMWERRYGFPQPERTASGHRRYSEDQAELVDRVLTLRRSGLSLPAAVARAQTPPDPDEFSLFATLRNRRPQLESRPVGKPALIALSHAIEDETIARAQIRLLIGCFQRERFYRNSQARWRELSGSARVAAVIADFAQARERRGIDADDPGPAEIPIGRSEQVAREWAIVAYGGRSSICMVAREQTSSNVDAATPARGFELLWTVEPEAVREVGQVAARVCGTVLPEIAALAGEQLTVDASTPPAEQVRLATAVVNRVLSAFS